MSSTNRGALRHNLDFYETPSWCTQLLLEREQFGPTILDAGCGTGAILRELDEGAIGLELDADRARLAQELSDHQVVCGDFLHGWKPGTSVGSIVMNPPYSLAREFILQALEIVPADGKVAALLRLNFLGSSRKRLDVVDACSGLLRVWVLAQRPSFTGDKKTDSCDYAWFVYRKGHVGPAALSVVTRGLSAL